MRLSAAPTRSAAPDAQRRKGFDPAADTIKVLTMHASNGLEYPVVAPVGTGHMPASGEGDRHKAKLFYAGAMPAKQRLIIGLSGEWRFAEHFAG